ncbi:hypothetical protein HYW29_00735 [Candidatus Amesbacteria bacterium]|nr:hypothetical protein [Candidatus Amesbacteria bacterium]
MTPQLKTAAIEFLANEFKMAPDNLTPDLSFSSDLGLSPSQLQDLLQRLQDSLNFILPEDSPVSTVSDLLKLVSDEEEPELE